MMGGPEGQRILAGGASHRNALDESLLLLERYCERSGRRLKVEEIALNPANDAAFVWLAGADAVAQRHPSEYVATFRLFEGVWKLVYFRQTRVS